MRVIRCPLSSTRILSWAFEQLMRLASCSCAVLSSFSRDFCASSWRLRNSASCSAGVSGPFEEAFASLSLASFAPALLSAGGGLAGAEGAFNGVALTPGGGVSPYWVLPFWSTHLYCCAD